MHVCYVCKYILHTYKVAVYVCIYIHYDTHMYMYVFVC